MIIVAGHWEIGYMAPLMESNFWNLVLRDFKILHWLMTPVTGIRHNEARQVGLKEFHDYKSMLGEYEDLPRVFLEPRTERHNPETIWLHDFTHPEDAVYVFGSAHYNPTIANHRGQDSVVSIKTLNDKGLFWANQCLSIVLYDRMVKSWL